MERAKFSFKKLFVNDLSLAMFAIFPAILCSLGIYGMLITQISEPTPTDHVVMASIGFVPSVLMFFVLVKMERGRQQRREDKRDKKRLLNRYKDENPFNNGAGLLSEFDGNELKAQLTEAEIALMKKELKKQVALRMEAGTIEEPKGVKLDLSVSEEFPVEEGEAVTHGARVYYRNQHQQKASVLKKHRSETRLEKPAAPQQKPLTLEEAIQERLKNAKTPEDAQPFREINRSSVHDTLKRLEEARRQKSLNSPEN